MKMRLLVLPRKGKGLRALAVCGLVISIFLVGKLIHDFFWLFLLIGSVLLIEKMITTASDDALQRDIPEPVLYFAEAPAVWSQVEKVIKTVPPRLDGVTARIEYSELHPPPGEPMHLQATFTLDHPELFEMRDLLSPEHRALKSKLYLDAFIEPSGNYTHLRLRWHAEPIMTRAKHDEIIDAITAEINAQIARYTKTK